MSNTFGKLFRVTTFGESHGPALGAVIDGCPAGVAWDQDLMNRELARRKPNQSGGSRREEDDDVEILSGVYEGKTLGTPIALLTRNQDARSKPYLNLGESLAKMRPGHATDLWQEKFGHSDPRGSGRASGRETVARVMGGAVAQMLLLSSGKKITIRSQLIEIAGETIFNNTQLVDQLEELRSASDSAGANVTLRMSGVPLGWGQPVFKKLKSEMAAALMSIGGVVALELGSGVQVSQMKGSALAAKLKNGKTELLGGIRGGLSDGEEIIWNVRVKPTASIGEFAQQSRHDPCIALRAAPVMEAMLWCVLADQILLQRVDRI